MTTNESGNAAAAEFFQAELLAVWLQLSENERPPNVWFRQHAPFVLVDDSGPPDSLVIAAWILKAGKIEARNVSEFLRFYVVHADRVWSSATTPPPSLWGRGPHEFALSSFAQIAGTDDFYFEWQFAGCRGRGSRYRLENGGFRIIETLWIS